MYGFQEYQEQITPEELLQIIPQEKIFEIIFGPIDLSKRYISPFRKDKRADCRFEYTEQGKLMFVDFGDTDSRTHRTCFGAIIDYNRGLTLSQAVTYILEYYKVENPRELLPSYSALNAQVNTFTPGSFKSKASITYNKRSYNKYDTLYWSSFYIKIEHLIEDNVFASSKFVVQTSKKRMVFTPFKYCYVIDFLDAVKVYQPYSSNFKWFTNCDEDHIGNIDNLPKSGQQLIIAKSYKDHRVLRNTLNLTNVIWFQNEGCVPSIDTLKNLVDRFQFITIFFDNDETGIKAAIKLFKIFSSIRLGCANIFILPSKLDRLGNEIWKDPGSFISKEGRKDFIAIIEELKLIINGKDTRDHT